MKKETDKGAQEEVIPEEGGIPVDELLYPDTSELAGWEHDPLSPVTEYQAGIHHEAFVHGVELAKVAIDLARLNGGLKPADCIEEARNLVFQCIKSVCRSNEVDAKIAERNRHRLNEHINRRLDGPRITESTFWGDKPVLIEVTGTSKPFSFEPYSGERKWNDFLKSHFSRIVGEELDQVFRDGLTFRHWLLREIEGGRTLPDCVKEHQYQYRLHVAERVWNGRSSGPGWRQEVLNDWEEAFALDWFQEMKQEFRENGVREALLSSFAQTRQLKFKTKGKGKTMDEAE